MIYRMSKKEKALFLTTIIFVSLVLFSRVVLSPVLGKSADLNQLIQLKKRMIENSLRLLNQKEEIEVESRKYAKYAKERLSEEEETAAFLKEIEDIARISQVRLIDLKPYSAKKVDFYTEHNIEVETESDMNQLITFIHNLQSSDSLLRVVKFRVSPKADKTSILRTYLTITRILISD